MAEAPARADWPNITLVAQESGNEFPSAVAIRQWPPSDRVYITVELADTSTPETTLELYRYLCSGGASCTPTLYGVGTWPREVGTAVPNTVALHPAMAIAADSMGVEDVDVIRRVKYDTDCDDDGITAEPAEEALDLQNFDYHTDTNLIGNGKLLHSNLSNTVNNACTDTGVSELLNDDTNTLNSCFTYKIDPTDPSTDRLRCKDASGVTGLWVNEIELTSSVVEDHPAFAFKDGERVVVGSRRPAGADNDDIRFHFPDVGFSPETNFGIGLDGDVVDGILPDIMSLPTANGDLLHAVWEADAHKELRVGRCLATEDCKQSTDWTVTTARSTVDGALNHPEIAHDGSFQILIFEDDEDETMGEERIYAMTRCGGTAAWSAPEIIRTPTNPDVTQSLLFGNPRLVVHREDNIAHVVFLEVDPPTGTAEVYWARKEYTDCP